MAESERALTTSLGEIRAFLELHGCAPAPWANSRRVVSALYAALAEKRDDPAFWRELSHLVARLDDRRFAPEALAGARVVGSDEIERIVVELRASLSGAKPRGARSWLAGAGAASVAGFLLLASASNGGGAASTPTAPLDRGENDDDAGEDEFGATQDDIDLIDVIRLSNVSASVKQHLLASLPELDAEYRVALLDVFMSMSDAEIAAFLDEMNRTDGIRKLAEVQRDFDDDGATASRAEELEDSDAAEPFHALKRACGCGDDDDDDDNDDDDH
ncbi:hypothetical protein K8I61_12340 [bacterium]|nr:hypothetical protein [bacterium]